MTETKVWVALIAVAIIAVGGYFFPQIKNSFGATGEYTAFSKLETGVFRVGSGCGNTFGSCTGTTENGFNFGNCQIQASSNTIAATTTAAVDCVLAAGTAPGTALTGVTTGDNVSVQTSTTTPSGFEGLQVRGASASSTPGYITVSLYNGTGATFTWTAVASTSFSYRAYR